MVRILATVRHPGPAHALATLVSAIPDAEWVIFAASDALTVLRQRSLSPVGLSVIVTPEARREVMLPWVMREVDLADPHLVVRTTPSTGFGADELIATLVAGRAPVIALQDFPAVGSALGLREHQMAYRPVDLVGCPDYSAADELASRGVPATAIGWIAHERFAHAPPWDAMRRAARQRVRADSRDVVTLVIGSSGDVPLVADEDLLRECAAFSVTGAHARSRLLYKPHPRRSAEEIRRVEALLARLNGIHAPVTATPLTESMTLALPDVIVSRASVMNLEALAYAAVWNRSEGPVSAYCGNFSTAIFPGYWGAGLPSTHRTGNGNVIAGPGELRSAVEPLLLDENARARFRRTATARYAPSPTVKEDLRDLVRSVGMDLP